MTSPTHLAVITARVRQRMAGQPEVSQAFVFGGQGAPFWAARAPITEDESALLADALRTLEETEGASPRSFFAKDPRGRFAVASLTEAADLYLVVVRAAARDVAVA